MHQVNTIFLACTIGLLLLLSSCDSDISGTAFENRAPDTQLAVRDTSLVDNIGDADRLASTVFVSWSGTDPDGFVRAYEIRFADSDEILAPEENWSRTTSTDTLILLPITRGNRFANVVFEVRAIDNEEIKDPTPARTVFPIQNAPPSLRLNDFELPPDTTFTIISFAWEADDPEGIQNLDRIEIGLNDSTNFISLAPDIEFLTLIANVDRNDQTSTVVDAELFTGRAVQRTNLTLPGLRLNDDNVLYLRAVDQTDTTSALIRYPEEESDTWYVKKPEARILFVNDFRKSVWPLLQTYHLNILQEYLPAGEKIDTWNLTTPFASGSSGATQRSDALPTSPEPMLPQTLALYDYIYWISTNTTNNSITNNLPFVANATNDFFEQGGRMMVHSPINLPSDPTDILGNPAILLLPLTDLLTFPDSLRQSLRLGSGAGINPDAAIPGLNIPAPALKTSGFILGTLPYAALGDNVESILTAEYTYLTRAGGRQGPWFGTATVASISADRRVGLFALPMISESTGDPLLLGLDDDPEAGRDAVKLMLESLNFPKR